MSTPYIVSARKYRPSTFHSVVGQPALTLTLKNAIESDRLAQAYLFCGPRGVGKTSCARIFAKTINCEHRTPEGEACNECESCRAFNEGRSINVVELDAASNNSVDNIRNLNDQVRVPPQSGRYRVFIIDEVHMLSTGAFNAFLKTLEEPPSYVIFILATTEKHKVIPTILSRCQIYDFNRIGVNDIAGHLAYVAKQEGISAEPSALGVIARKADGAMRDALSIFDQVSASTRGNITYQGTIDNLNVLDYEFYFRLVDAFLKGDVPTALLIYKEVRDKGFDSLSFVGGLANHLRELTVAMVPQTLPLLEVSADVAERYKQQASQIKPRWAYNAMEIVNSCDMNFRTAGNKQFHVELTLIRLCQLSDPTGATDSKGTPSRNALHQPTASSAPAQPPATPTPTSADSTPAASPALHTPKLAVSPVAAKSRLRTDGISISNLTSAPKGSVAAEPSPANAPALTPSQGVSSLDNVLKGWDSFCSAHRDMRLLCTIMKESRPAATGSPSTYEVAVLNQGQAAEFNKELDSLVPYLREYTGDNALSLRVVIAEKAERKPMLTPREAFANMLNAHEKMRSILSELGGVLAD
ncbi:MAG: DNA polymerase III subunit gamma/tau [Prevotella sp.]|nr:DNA polymerase III subunit gamma/tau [Prevotella sp.]MCM1074476.1 DNA polymerase III subunit gamma/tau [Ruminococcus sp.]